MFIETETTPNPASLKFLPGQQVMAQGTREFASPEAAEASPLAQAIFDTGEVVNVFFGGDFVTVTVAPGGSWSDLKPQVLAILLDHFVSEAPLFAAAPGTAAGFSVPPEDEALLVEDDPANADIVAQINELLETRVRPAVAGDGGDIRYRGFKDGIVYLTMQGACAGCPSSTATSSVSTPLSMISTTLRLAGWSSASSTRAGKAAEKSSPATPGVAAVSASIEAAGGRRR